ncbi:50S ribosomal protein L25 [Candidatus Saccharibacteria bacterium]|nr:50S ribosomal protein L25 [Candidatus Saccharibacteria bacterium]MBH2007359.1 50S ribosomal protein L25 [Candidatus Saccharibacteria bacterium]
MGSKIELTLEERTVHGKKVAQLRQESIVPAVVYGPGMKPVSVQANHNLLEKIYKQAGNHTPVHITIGTKKRIAMIKDVEFNVVKHTINHVSFHAVKANEPVVAEVPIHLVGTGESEAERAGLVVLQALEKIEVKALPMDLPESLEVSILELANPNDRITVADLTMPANVEIVDHVADPNADEDVEQHSVTELVIASVYEPSALQAANDAAGGDAEDASAESVDAEQGSEAAEEKSA